MKAVLQQRYRRGVGGERVNYLLQTAPEPAALGPTSDGRGSAPAARARGGGAGRRGPGERGRPGRLRGGWAAGLRPSASCPAAFS